MAMQQQDLDRLLNQARVKLPGASDAGMKGELFDVISEFFKDSRSWVEILSIPILPAITQYSLIPQQDGQIILLAGVWDPSQVAQPAFMPDFGTLNIVNAVNNPQTFTVAVIKNIEMPTTREMIPIAPDWLLRVYHLTILDGLLGKMMGTKNKTYSDDTQSVYHLRRFRDGIAMARVAVARQYTYGAQAWTFPKQFRTTNQRGGISTADPLRF